MPLVVNAHVVFVVYDIDVACSVCMFSSACVENGRLTIFTPPDVGEPNDADMPFSPASFAITGQHMLFQSPNWWESGWTPAVVVPLPVLHTVSAVAASYVTGAVGDP